MTICRECSRSFRASRSTVKFCGAKCRIAATRERIRLYQRELRKHPEAKRYRREWMARRRLDPHYRAREHSRQRNASFNRRQGVRA